MANPAAAAPLVATVKRRRRAAGDRRADARQCAAGAGYPAGRQDQQTRSRRPTGPASTSACSRRCRPPPRSIAARWSDGARGRRRRALPPRRQMFSLSPAFATRASSRSPGSPSSGRSRRCSFRISCFRRCRRSPRGSSRSSRRGIPSSTRWRPAPAFWPGLPALSCSARCSPCRWRVRRLSSDTSIRCLNFNQGIPALSWVVIAIIWFRGIEFRIFFIMVMTTLPAFTFQVLDAYRAMSKDLFEMTLSFRPTRLDLLRTLIWPTVLPGILTAWKVNLGNASRVVVVAELVGATGGVGYELLQQQQLFDMAGRHRLDAGARDFRARRAGHHHADRNARAALPRVRRACACEHAAGNLCSKRVSKSFARRDGGPAFEAVRDLSFAVEPRRAGRDSRQDRLRQVDDVQSDLRAHPAVARPCRGAGPRSLCRLRLVPRQDRHRVSERPADAVAHRDR